ncbi:hypothetical protein GCM10009799_13210 [Nocardiopsis rhodophaea]|uniref:Cupin type-2 domain-containing protein n=1 Tax=Nocardiopsis rhodophaea TaxID=280238 RepID=A0ABN2SM23_9ACTN
MPMTPIDLFTSAIHLHQDGQVNAEQQTMGSERERGSWLLTAVHAETDADVHGDHWEVHPDADEFVSCLSGAIRLILRPEQLGDEEEVKLTAGTAAIVPSGRWHRIALDAPGDIMAVTLPRGSRLEKRTDA